MINKSERRTGCDSVLCKSKWFDVVLCDHDFTLYRSIILGDSWINFACYNEQTNGHTKLVFGRERVMNSLHNILIYLIVDSCACVSEKYWRPGAYAGGVKGVQKCPFGSVVCFFLLTCLSERSVMYEDIPTPSMENCHNFLLEEEKKYGSHPPPPLPPPPPSPAAKLFIPLQFRTPVRTHLHTANQRPRVLICIQPIHRG